eukprot:gene30874-35918_t
MAEIYYTTRISGKTTSVAAWSRAPGFPSVLAVGLSPNAVGVYTEEGGHLILWNYEERSTMKKTVRRIDAAITKSTSMLTVWKTDRLNRPLYVTHFDEQPGCTILHCVLGPVQPVGEDGSQVSTTFFYGVTKDNATWIKFGGDQGLASTVVQEFPEGLHHLIYYAPKDQLVVTTASCNLHVLGRDEEANPTAPWTTVSKMKFATGTGEAATSLQVDSSDMGGGTKIVCLAADNRSGMLAAGTADGRVTVFKYTDSSKEVNSKALRMEWGPNPRLMCVITDESVNACRKTLLNHRLRDGMVVIQAGVDKLLIESMPQPPSAPGEPTPPIKPPSKLQTPIQILGLDFSKNTLMVYNGAECLLYKVDATNEAIEQGRETRKTQVHDNNEAVAAGGFETSSRAMALQNDSIFCVNENRLEVCNTGGTVKQTLSFDDTTGPPVLLDICKDYLAAVTTNNYVRVFKVAGREAKPHAGPGMILPPEMGGAGLFIDQIKVNASGTMVSALVSSKDHSREQKMFVFCSETNNVVVYDFAKDHKVPQLMAWDVAEPRLLGIQTLALNLDNQLDLGASLKTSTKGPGFEVAMVFVSGEHGVLMQEYQDMDSTGAKGFIGLQAPSLVLNKQTKVETSSGKSFFTSVFKVIMQGFTGMQRQEFFTVVKDGDESSKSALLDFSFHMATSNVDEAFRATKTIKNNTISL